MTDRATAVQGIKRGYHEMPDGTRRVYIDVGAEDIADFDRLFLVTDVAVALAPLWRTAEEGADYGQFARQLRLSPFFRTRCVWRAIGTDGSYLTWLRQQEVCKAKQALISTRFCSGPVVAAHVRRIANGAGAGIKPEYSAISLCWDHHELQHAKGERAIGGKDWCDRKRVEQLQQWGWETLKGQLGYESFKYVAPTELRAWAEKKGVAKHLPIAYQEAA